MIDFLRELFVKKVKIDTKILPSQGLFYEHDFEIFIKRASKEDILYYEKEYIRDVGTIIYLIKKIVEKNISLSKDYTYDDIKSIDLIFIFLEIVKITINKPINLFYFDNQTKRKEKIEFNKDSFNYFNFTDELLSKYDSKDKSFKIDEYKFTLPSIGVENSLTNFLIKNSNNKKLDYNNLTYDFTYFVGNKKFLQLKEIENLILIFNFDIDRNELIKIKKIIELFSQLQRYSLKKNNEIVDLGSKINLELIWK